MILLLILAGLFGVFFLLRRRPGPAFLAVIAGLSVYNLFGQDLAAFLAERLTAIPLNIFQFLVYLALILLFPLLLYLRSSSGGLFGPVRIICAAGLAALITCLVAPQLKQFIAFDGLSVQIADFINNNKGTVVLVGIIAAYLDILIARF